MKLVLLAGGIGSRISEESALKPKPMITIGDMPILCHIMKLYSHYGINEFIICCGYKGYIIKEYFANYFLHRSDVTFDLSNNSLKIHRHFSDPWKVTLVDTGQETMTGGRLKRIKEHVGDDDFCMTYGDGLSDINIKQQIEFHFAHKKRATLAGVYPPGRFGALNVTSENTITSFEEKPKGDGALINGGFFILSPKTLDLIEDDTTIWEQEPLKNLAKMGELKTFIHEGFWQPMDTLRDKNYLESLWNTGKAPWKIWN